MQRAQEEQTVALVNLTLYPGRSEFSYFPDSTPRLWLNPWAKGVAVGGRLVGALFQPQ